jgi:hypothetical protein
VIGLLANTCIESTGRFAMELGYHVTLVKDATAAFKREMMHAAHGLNGPTFAHAILTTEALIAALPPLASPRLAEAATVDSGFAERFAEVNGVRLRYLIGGKGSPVVLLQGYAETSHMWQPIMPSLAERHTVIVPDLRGAGGSSKPELTGEKASGNFLIEQAKPVASDVRGQVVVGAGHWLMEEAPQTVIPAITAFIQGGGA